MVSHYSLTYYYALRLNMVARIELPFKIEVVCSCASVFNYFNFFRCQETVNVLHFDLSGI